MLCLMWTRAVRMMQHSTASRVCPDARSCSKSIREDLSTQLISWYVFSLLLLTQ